MPTRREDPEEESDYLSSSDELGAENWEFSRTKNRETLEQLKHRFEERQRTLEWRFFEHEEKWGGNKASNHRKAKCKNCESVSRNERNRTADAYRGGAFISLSCDGWTTPSHRKCLGQCSILRSRSSGSITIHTRRMLLLSEKTKN